MELLKKWYEQYGNELYRTLAKAVKNSDLAQEISQETFLKMAVKISRKDNNEIIRNPRAFLYKIAYNELYTRHNKHKLQEHLRSIFADSEFEVQNNITPEKIAIDQEELDMVHQAIQQLPNKQQKAFTLSRTENLSHSEIAANLGVKKGTVKQHIVRALSILRGVRNEK